MSDYPSSWNYNGDVLRPRRRNIFFKGRRRGDRWMARAVILLSLALVGMTIKAFWADVPLPERALAHETVEYQSFHTR
jgi:hypothetical protein